MTLQQLRYVVVTATEKSMNKAASILFISQHSLSTE
jgi:DNA-binding transcriptional LysR family regulator